MIDRVGQKRRKERRVCHGDLQKDPLKYLAKY